jgi:hypothetical protein
MVAGMMAALPVLLAGQDQSAQNQPAQSQPGQSTPVQSSADKGATTAAPAPAAVSGILGVQIEGVTSEDSSNTLPQIPALLGGIGISPAFLPELERSNYLRAGVNVGATYDDNPLLFSSGAVGNASVSIFPNLSIEQTSSRLRWKMAYAGGLTINQRLTNQDQGSHNLNFDSQYRLSPHVNLRVAENFSLTTGYFDGGGDAVPVAGTGGPNASLIVPLSTQRSSLTTVETNYHFALNDLIGASGSFYDLHFTNLPAADSGGTQLTTSLTGSETASGSAFWLHRIFGGDWAGTSYRFARISFNGGESQIHSFFGVDTLNLSTRFTLTGFIGPQYSENQGFLVAGTAADNWSLAGGAEGGFRDQRTSVLAGYSRSISDGGGVLGAVRLQNVYGNFRRELVPGWAAAVTASHGSNQALLLLCPTCASSVTLTSVGVSLERNVGKSVGFRLGYSHDLETGLNGSSSTLDAHRNRVFATLSYQWAKPLGM